MVSLCSCPLHTTPLQRQASGGGQRQCPTGPSGKEVCLQDNRDSYPYGAQCVLCFSTVGIHTPTVHNVFYASVQQGFILLWCTMCFMLQYNRDSYSYGAQCVLCFSTIGIHTPMVHNVFYASVQQGFILLWCTMCFMLQYNRDSYSYGAQCVLCFSTTGIHTPMVHSVFDHVCNPSCGKDCPSHSHVPVTPSSNSSA